MAPQVPQTFRAESINTNGLGPTQQYPPGAPRALCTCLPYLIFKGY